MTNEDIADIVGAIALAFALDINNRKDENFDYDLAARLLLIVGDVLSLELPKH